MSFSGCKTSAAQSTRAAAATGNAPAATATEHFKRQGNPIGSLALDFKLSIREDSNGSIEGI
jgi:hypothetical protein